MSLNFSVVQSASKLSNIQRHTWRHTWLRFVLNKRMQSGHPIMVVNVLITESCVSLIHTARNFGQTTSLITNSNVFYTFLETNVKKLTIKQKLKNSALGQKRPGRLNIWKISIWFLQISIAIKKSPTLTKDSSMKLSGRESGTGKWTWVDGGVVVNEEELCIGTIGLTALWRWIRNAKQ